MSTVVRTTTNLDDKHPRPTQVSNQYGHFSADGTEYRITNPKTPRPWVNIIANPRFGLAVSQTGSGFTWVDNSQLAVITRWQQDLARDSSGTFLYVRDNEGLALLCCDLVQNDGNPAFLDIPPADGVPPEMTNFSRPDGVSNPGETDPVTGYIGVQRGDAGQMNLIQIGGGQNTFGEAMPPGTGVAENAIVVGGVGQSAPLTLASGSFDTPSDSGAYTFELASALANVLVERNDPPDFSPVTEATVDTTAGSFSFTITLVGDVDLDCDVDLADLAQLLAHYGQTSGMTWTEGDLDGDGGVNLTDLAMLLSNYGQTCE